MQLFTADLYRNFALGFAAGTLIMGIASFDQWSDQIAPPAHAAEPTPTQDIADEFLIAPVEADD